jgi:hypothetical protein
MQSFGASFKARHDCEGHIASFPHCHCLYSLLIFAPFSYIQIAFLLLTSCCNQHDVMVVKATGFARNDCSCGIHKHGVKILSICYLR